MPSTAPKMDIKPAIEICDPFKQLGLSVDKKIRNMEKRKVKLDGYRDEQDKGKSLNEDQRNSVKQYDKVLQALDNYKEMQKLYSIAALDNEKFQKKIAKKQKIEKSAEIQLYIQKYLKLDFIVSKFGDDVIRNDFITGENGAVMITELDLQALDKVAEIALFIPNNDFRKRIVSYSQFVFDFCEQREKPLFADSDDPDQVPMDYTFAQLGRLVQKILDCDYLDNLVEEEEEEEEEAVEEQKDIKENDAEEQEEQTVELEHNSEDVEAPLAAEAVAEQAEGEPWTGAVENNTYDHQNQVITDEVEQNYTCQDEQTNYIIEEPASNEEIVDYNKDVIDDFVVLGEVEINDAVNQDYCAQMDQQYVIEDDEFLKLSRKQPMNPARTFTEIVSSVQGDFNFTQESRLVPAKPKEEVAMTPAARHHQPSSYIPQLSPPQQQALFNDQGKFPQTMMMKENENSGVNHCQSSNAYQSHEIKERLSPNPAVHMSLPVVPPTGPPSTTPMQHSHQQGPPQHMSRMAPSHSSYPVNPQMMPSNRQPRNMHSSFHAPPSNPNQHPIHHMQHPPPHLTQQHMPPRRPHAKSSSPLHPAAPRSSTTNNSNQYPSHGMPPHLPNPQHPQGHPQGYPPMSSMPVNDPSTNSDDVSGTPASSTSPDLAASAQEVTSDLNSVDAQVSQQQQHHHQHQQQHHQHQHPQQHQSAMSHPLNNNGSRGGAQQTERYSRNNNYTSNNQQSRNHHQQQQQQRVARDNNREDNTPSQQQQQQPPSGHHQQQHSEKVAPRDQNHHQRNSFNEYSHRKNSDERNNDNNYRGDGFRNGADQQQQPRSDVRSNNGISDNGAQRGFRDGMPSRGGNRGGMRGGNGGYGGFPNRGRGRGGYDQRYINRGTAQYNNRRSDTNAQQ